MQLNERQIKILDLLKKTKRLSVKKTAGLLYVSEMTVRRDFKLMEENGYLQRYNGGAVLVESEGFVPIKMRKLLHANQKKILSEKAGSYLHDDMTVYVDSSSTCMYISNLLSQHKNIRVITNSVQNLLTIVSFHIPCILIGGDYCEQDMCTVGSYAEWISQKINVDIAFLSTYALSDDGIISDRDERQTAIRRIIMTNAKKKVFLFTSEKLHRKSLHTLCSVNDIDELILI